MIKVNNLNKFYNKNKVNEIHVINDISLEFDNTGLVCLLGPSGSGKTTLLNAIGGLDKVDNGVIQYNEEMLNQANSSDCDFIRNKHVGYIFQNYNLLLNLTVYENIMFTLKMTDLIESDAHQRVMYALKSVGLEKYYKRKVTQLSGGQQQRVAIARALAKSPNVIIADEPTGNLDEKNTTAVMNILKQIAKKTLVILVTHEERIANFYANRIIRLKDGQIMSDEVNKNTDNYSYNDDSNIYLKDLNKETTNNSNVNINYFYDKEKVDINLNVISKDGVIYIESLNKQIKLVSNDDVKVINSNKPILNIEQIEEVNFDIEKIENKYYRKKSNIKYKDTFNMAFKRILEMKRKQKLVFLGFLLSAFLFVFAVSTLYSAVVVDEKDFIRSGYNEYSIISDNIASVIVEENIGIVHEPINFNIIHDSYLQAQNQTLSIQHYSTSQNLKTNLKDSDIFLGEYGDYNSILLDKMVIDELVKNSFYYKLGFDSYEDFIGLNVNDLYTISGIVDKQTPEIYLSQTAFMGELNGSTTAIAEDLNMSVSSKEVLINDYTKPVNSIISFNGIEYKVVGHQDVCEYVFNEVDYKLMYLESRSNSYFTLHSYDNEITNKFLSDNEDLIKDAYNVYDESKASYKEQILFTALVFLVLSVVLIITSLIFLYFIMRSSLISRVYEIGVYRALGITKKDIRKIFSSEILLISLFSSFIGYIIAILLISNVGGALGLSLHYLLWIPILILIMLLNILIGLKPINSLLKLTPSEIGSKYDI
ncbi:MAG: ABC transporter ATP-binding protein/permease [bacterium]